MSKHKLRALHVGYPPLGGGRSLQFDFFRNHPRVYFLGDNAYTSSGWADAEIGACAEVDFRAASIHTLNPNRMREAFARHFNAARNDPRCSVVALSVDWMAVRRPYDCDAFTKASRMFDVFGYGAKIIVVIRNQFEMLRTLYLHAVRNGLGQSFEEYLDFMCAYPFASGLEDLYYDEILKIYGDLFGYENILVVLAECISANPDFEYSRIAGFIGLDAIALPPPNLPEDDSPQMLEMLRQLNRAGPETASAQFLGFISPNVFRPFIGLRGPRLLPRFEDAFMRRREWALEEARRRSDEAAPIDVEFGPVHRAAVSAIFAPRNREVMRTWRRHDLAANGYPS